MRSRSLYITNGVSAASVPGPKVHVEVHWSISSKPHLVSSRRSVISCRQISTAQAPTLCLYPSKSSRVAAIPPRKLARSATSTFAPPFASTLAATRPLWPAPMMIAS